jgi:Leucine-rich repeat (LRR) protein
MKIIEITNEKEIILGIDEEFEPCTYVFQEKNYSAVEWLHIITHQFDFNVIINTEVLNMPKLKSIGISGPGSVDIFNNIYKKLDTIPYIDQILFDATGIVKPPDFIWDAKHLTRLEFRNEPIAEIPDQLFDMNNLQSLSFPYCRKITTVPDNIKKLVNLVHFDLWGARIAYLSQELFLLPKIKHINFAYSSYTPTIEDRKVFETYKEKTNNGFSTGYFEW